MGVFRLPKNQQMVQGFPINRSYTKQEADNKFGGGSASPLTTKGDLYGFSTVDARIPVGADGEVLTADSTDPTGVSWQPTATSAVLTYMFANTVSDIGATYLQAVSLNSYTASTKSDQSGTATTSGVTIGRFATNLGFPNVTLIPAGTITLHYDTEKGAGSNNYYTYAQVYKRNLAGTETLLATSDNSAQTASNTQQSVTVTAVLASDTSLLSTDRIVVKVVAVMVSSTATIHVYGDDATSARIELPTAQIDATNYVTITSDQTITGTKTFLKTALGTTPTPATILSNTTSATSGNQQVSPATRWSGAGWNTGGAGSSRAESFEAYLLPVQGANGGITSNWVLRATTGSTTFTDRFSVANTGTVTSTIQSGQFTGYEISASMGNTTPDTTQHIKLSNSSQYTWITGYFSGVLKSAFGFENNGTIRYASQNGYHRFYSGTSSLTLIADIYGAGFYNNGGNFNAGRVTAGSATVSPPTTFSNYGSTSLKTTVITTNTTLTDDYTQVIADCSSNDVCTGTPSQTDCTTYTGSGQATCESHLPCVWNAGSSCSVFDNESGMISCAGQAGCSVSTTSCSSANNTDQSTCEAQDDAYGGACSWDTSTCPAQTSTSACNAITGCYADVSGDCSTLSDGGGDGTNCATQPECSYDSGTGVCYGYYFTSCSGNLCGGYYYNGSCIGTYGTACTGTVTCGGYASSGACTGEAGCTWSSGVTLTMPASPEEQTYWIAKDYTSGTLTILPNSGQTINNTTSITSSSTTGVGWMLTWVQSKSNWYIMNKH